MAASDSPSKAQKIGLWLGPVAGLSVALALPSQYGSMTDPVLLGQASAATACLAVWMAIWWLTEAIEIYATALLPLVVLPLFGGLAIRDVAAPYAHEIIFLFLGGFSISLAMEASGLHRRIAIRMIAWFGNRPSQLVAGFMLTTAFLSMWISNTATALMLLPIALSLSGEDEQSQKLQVPLLLAIAYSASIGGVATIIGTPPNAFLVSYASDHLNVTLGFVDWMQVGVPVSLLMLFICWFVLTRWLFPLKDLKLPTKQFDRIKSTLGLPSRMERWVLLVFVMTVVLWVTRTWIQDWRWGDGYPFAGLSDPLIAMMAALMLFAVPVTRDQPRFALRWSHMQRMPWGILLLFGGGLSLARAIDSTGLGIYIGSLVSAADYLPSVLILILIVVLVVFLTELTSNTATTASLVPVFAIVAPSLGFDPLALATAVAISASFAFMLPVATPPNAVVFGSGKIQASEMARAGFWLNIIGIFIVTLASYLLIMPLLGV